ncbi:unnamed protein product [Amaranthus hypochondriacus]
MEGLIPYLVRAIKTQNLHKHSYQCLSDHGSRRSYHLLGSAGDSFNGSLHRRTLIEFQPPTALEMQPELQQSVPSTSINTTTVLRQMHHSTAPVAAYDYDNGNKHEYKKNNKLHKY